MFYSLLEGIGIQSINYEITGTVYESNIKDQFSFFDLDLIHKYLILGNND